MQLGIFAKTFPGNDAATVLKAVRDAGYSCTQFNMACVGLPSMPDDIADAVIAAIAAAAGDSRVTLSALSATYNMIHPDRAVRDAGMHRLRVVAQAARALKIPLVTLCTGTRDPDDQWIAEAEGVDLGIEPEQANVVTSARDARRLIDEMGSRRVKIILDPANLFEQATPDEARRIVAEAVDAADGAIAMAHAKDRRPDGRFATVGEGVVDFPDFLARLQAAGFDGPVVTHGLTAAEAPKVAAYLAGLVAR